MDVLLLGASGRIGQRITNELLDRGHAVTGVSRRGDAPDGVGDADDFVAVAGDATDPDDVAELAEGHDAVASALGPSEDEDTDVLEEMMTAVIEGMRRASVDRLVWTGGAAIMKVGPDTRLIETEEFPDGWVPVAQSAIDAYGVLAEADDLRWTYVTPAALIEPGERTGEYRTSTEELVTDDEGDSYVSMEDFAIAFVDELEGDEAIHQKLNVAY